VTTVNILANKCKTRGDSFVIVDPKMTDTTQALNATTVNALTGSSAPGYSAIYTPCLEMVDPLKTGLGAARTTYPGGAVAGVFVRTELARSVAKAPAGYDCTIVGALGISVKYTDGQVGAMYDASVQSNSFKAIPGAGVAIMGARTVERVNPDRFIPVRRTLNYVKRSVKDIAAAYVFEPNDANLWIKLNNDISNFLNNFWRSGGLKGAKSTDAFFVVCDKTNNTASSIDQGIVNVSIGIAVTYPAEFIVINVSQWTGGSNAVEINL
jgi:phage tail sheath protein FI